MEFMKDSELIAKYEGAKAIYVLTRKKIMSAKEKAFDWGVALLSPFPGVVDEADKLSDLGAYFLVINDNGEFLVRVEGRKLTEENIAGKYTAKSDKKLVYDGNIYTKVRILLK